MGYCSASSVSRLARKFWNSFGQGGRRPLDNPHEMGAQVGVGVAVTANDVHRPRLGQLKGLFEIRPRLGKDRHPTSLVPFMVFRLRARNSEPFTGPVYVRPLQTENHLLMMGLLSASMSVQSWRQTRCRLPQTGMPPLRPSISGVAIQPWYAKGGIHRQLEILQTRA
jgi:hypothetical protein